MTPESMLRRAGGQTDVLLPQTAADRDESKPAIWYEADEWDEATIPRRPWLAAGYLLRGSVTAVVGPGGVSKSSLMLSWAAHLALGLPCHRMEPVGPLRVMIYNVEDDAEEQRRRLTGILRGLGKTSHDVAGKIARIGPCETGTLMDRNEAGVQIDTRALQDIETRVAQFRPDVLIFDPLAELHTFEENDNTALRGVVARFRALATKHRIAVVLLHHTRKGVVAPGDADAVRGASSIVSAARVVLTVTGMTEEDARAFGLPAETRKHYFRVDGGKSNYAGLTEAEWFERVTHTLANDDTVVAVTPWSPPADVCTVEIMAAIKEGIAKGSPHGPWSPQLGNTERSVKHLLVESGITTAPGQKDALAALMKVGFEALKYKDHRRKLVSGLRAPDGQPSKYEWE